MGAGTIGKEAGEPLDLYAQELQFGPEQSLGVFTLPKVANTFSAVITGSNPAAAPARMFGLDYVRLVPVE